MAAEQLPGAPRSIALIDISYIWKRNWLGMHRDAAPGDAAQKTLHDLAGIRESVEHVIICCDAPPYWRKEILESYKASREPPSEAELSQKRWTMDRLEKEGYQIAKCKSFEAEDIMATLVAAMGFWCPEIRLVASDKDVACLVTETVRMHVPAVGVRSGEIRGPKEIQAKYGVEPKDMPLWLALCGDDSDDVPGIPGVGAKKAAEIIKNCVSLAGIEEAASTVASDPKSNKMWQSIAAHLDDLRLALKLVELRRDVPIDPNALLAKKERQTIVKPDAMRTDDGVPDADFIPISRAPEGYVAPAVKPAPEAKTEAPKATTPVPPRATVTSPDATATPAASDDTSGAKPSARSTTALAKYGVTSEDLQPLDLESARNIARWIYDGQLYPQFKSPEAVFSVILRGKELALGVTTALAGFHIVEGRPTASADLLRALAERSPKCEYFRLISSDAKSATWETKHRDHSEPTPYTYTIEEAELAGLLKPSRRTGEPSNWLKRPRDLVTKTSGAKLARLVYPGDTLGLYCQEEMSDE